MRCSLQSLSDAHCDGSMWAHVSTPQAVSPTTKAATIAWEIFMASRMASRLRMRVRSGKSKAPGFDDGVTAEQSSARRDTVLRVRIFVVLATVVLGADASAGCGRSSAVSATALAGNGNDEGERERERDGRNPQDAAAASMLAPGSADARGDAAGNWRDDAGNDASQPRAAAGAAVAAHVIIISEDGLRPDALLKANGSVHGRVMREGAFSLHATTIRHASTLPSHAAMLSGFDEREHGLTWNSWRPERGYIRVPTVFDAAARAGHPGAVFVGKQKLAHIVTPGSVDVFSRPGYLCKKVVAEAARYFLEKRPVLEFVHFSDPDERGHAIGWMSEPQIASIRETDRCLATLLAAVHEAGCDADTLFILSADHGGHGRNHSGRIQEDRLIPWIAWGAGVRAGHHIQGEVSTMDTAATVLWALGYPAPPDMQGHPVAEAFSPSPPAGAPLPADAPLLLPPAPLRRN